MQSSFVEDLYNSRGGRGRGLGRGGAPGLGRGRGGAKTYHDERSELELAKQTITIDTAIKANNTKKGEGVGARYGFIPGASPTVGLGGSGPIGQGANRGFVPHAGRGRGAPPPSVHIPPGFCAPAIPGPVGIPFKGIRQDPPHLTPSVPVQAVPFAQVTIPGPINTQGAPNGGRGRGSRGGWFKGANGRQDDEIQPNNGDEASDGNRGGRGWRGGFTGRGKFTPRGGFHGRGRGTVEGSDRGGRGQFQYRGRGGRGRGGTGPWRDRAQANGERRPSWEPVVDNLPPARGMRENVVRLAIAELTAPHVAVVDKPTKPENLQCISSYTWKKGRNPTLIVPGSPREWLDRALPFKVDFDSGVRMFHEDAFYMAAESTLIPLFRAVDAMSAPSENADAIEWATVDFVTDRNNLRKLLRWIREPGPTPLSSPTSETSPISPTSDSRESSDTVAEWDPRKDFRIDLQLGGEKSVLMQRWAARAREMIAPPKGGCRANFEREHTAAAPGCEDAGGHYRIVQYNIGGLKMVVRFEVDACVAMEAEVERDGPPHSQQPENNARAAAVATSDDPISNIVTSGGAKSPARQSFTTKDEKALWASGNPADDWGIPEEPPTPQLGPSDEPEVNRSETEEVDSDKEAEMWAGGGHDSWGMPSESPRLSKGKGKADTRDRAPAPEDLSWDILDDGAAWGVATDVAQDEETLEPNGELTVVRSGTLLPQSSILELATRSIRYADRTSNEDTFLQIFLTQTPTHLVAIHQNGNFEKVVRQELESAEFTSIAEMEGIQKSVAQFVELLKEIQRLVKEHGTSGRLSLVCEKGKLELFGLGGEEGRLSDGELERFKASTQTQA